MHQRQKDLQLKYEGFLKTPFLWHGKGVFDLVQFEIVSNKTSTFYQPIDKKLRLGKLVERFVSQELQRDNSVHILAENIQIQNNKITLGELDCLLTKDNTPIHLEIIYKFYLYDESVGNSEIEHWIGPNRRDSFIQKLTKLEKKQLPLLYSNHCKPYLNELNLDPFSIKQQVYFKAQLFIPLRKKEQFSTTLNSNCIYGFYIYPNQLDLFSSCKFYIPNKLNWLVEPHSNLNWSNFENFKNDVEKYLAQENSPLCWMKKPNGELIKFFVVWWS